MMDRLSAGMHVTSDGSGLKREPGLLGPLIRFKVRIKSMSGLRIFDSIAYPSLGFFSSSPENRDCLGSVEKGPFPFENK